MSVYTTYDEMRDNLREQLNDCLRLAKDMLDENIWGYKDMRSDYAIELYIAIKQTKDKV